MTSHYRLDLRASARANGWRTRSAKPRAIHSASSAAAPSEDGSDRTADALARMAERARRRARRAAARRARLPSHHRRQRVRQPDGGAERRSSCRRNRSTRSKPHGSAWTKSARAGPRRGRPARVLRSDEAVISMNDLITERLQPTPSTRQGPELAGRSTATPSASSTPSRTFPRRSRS